MRRRTLAFFVLFSCSLFWPVFAGDTKTLVRLDGLTKAEILALAGTEGLEVAKAGKTSAEVVMTAEKAAGYKKAGARIKTLIPDLDAYVTKRLQAQTRAEHYYTFDTMTTRLKTWAEQYSSIARLHSIGKSCEGRDLWAMKVSDNPDLNEKEASCLIVGAHHAREWISVEVPMETLKRYLEGYGKDEAITRLVNEREVWFVPMINPDGVTYSQNKSRYWRKNRRQVDNRNFGVDLNRNYGYKWGNTGASSSPGSDVYHGTGAFSEPETAAIKDLAEREHFQASISFHSYSELILYPFGYGYNIPNPDTAVLSKFAQEMARFNRYTPENSADLYPAMGDSDDWLYGANKTLAFTFELAQEFIPSPGEIDEINNLNVPAVLYLIDKCAAYAVNSPTGDEAVVAALDPADGIAALSMAKDLLTAMPVETRMALQDRLEKIEDRVAEAIRDQVMAGDSRLLDEAWDSCGEGLRRKIQHLTRFAAAHGQTIRSDLAAKMGGAR